MLAPCTASIRCCNLTLGYDGHPAVHHLDGEITSGSLVAIVGPNGSGKSTLLKGLVGLMKPMEGVIGLGGHRRRGIAYLPQQADIDRSFLITVQELVSLGLWQHVGSWRGIGQNERRSVEAAILAVGLEGFEQRTLGTLSGGQLQRVLFARVLVQDSPLILLDEPFTAIDARTAADLIQRWHGERRTVIAVLHDLELARDRFGDALILARKVVAWGRARDVVTPENLRKARVMAERWDEAAPLCEDRSIA